MQSAKELLTEVTDIDNRLLRTIATLIVKPRRLVESRLAKEDRYTSPLKVWMFTASGYIVLQFLFEWFIGNEDPRWWLPLRVTSGSELYIGLFQALFPLMVLFTVVPALIVVLKILYRKRSWCELTIILMYVLSVFWMVMIPLIPFNYFSDADFIVPTVGLIIIILTFRRAINDKLLPSILKWMIVIILTLLLFFKISTPIAHRTFEAVLLSYNTPSPHAVPLSEEPLSKNVQSIEDIHPIRHDPDHMIAVLSMSNGIEVSCITSQNKIVWSTLLPGVSFFRKAIKLQPNHSDPLYIILTDSNGREISSAFVLSSAGKIIYEHRYEEKMVLNGACLLNDTLMLSGGRQKDNFLFPFIDIVKFQLEKDKFNVVSEKTYFIEKDKERFDAIDILKDSSGRPVLIATKYASNSAFAMTDRNEISDVSVLSINTDSTLLINWEHSVFRKNTIYSPRKDYSFNLVTDNEHARSLVYYSLSDDSTLASYVFAVSATGKRQWSKRIASNNITVINDVYPSLSGIYFAGHTTSGLSNPIGFNNHQGLFGRITPDGRSSTQFTYGSYALGRIQYGEKIIIGDSLKVVSFTKGHNPLASSGKWNILSFDKTLLE